MDVGCGIGRFGQLCFSRGLFFILKKTPILNPHLITWNREGHVAIATDGPPTTPMNPTPKQSNLTDIDDRSIVMTFAHVKPSGDEFPFIFVTRPCFSVLTLVELFKIYGLL